MLFSNTPQLEHPQQAAWPPVPLSLSHESFDMDERKPPVAAQPPRRSYYRVGDITPWLGLRSRLSQVPMNRWTVLLLLVLARLLLSLAGLNTNLVGAKQKALSACTKVEDIGSSMASMPHYLSVGVNRLAADGITKTVQGMVEILLMVLTGVQKLILFFIEFEIGTFVCLSSAIAQAVLELTESAINGTTEALNNAIKGIAGDMSDVASTISGDLDKLRGKAKDVPFVGQDITNLIPDTSGLTDGLSKLDNVQIDTSSIVSGISDLEQKIDYKNIQNLAEEAIAVPFDMVKRLLNESYGSWEFDESVFPVAGKESLSFCSDNSTLEDFFEVLFKIAANAKIIATAVLIVLAVLACAVMAWWEIKRFNRQLEKSRTLIGREPMDIAYISGRPLTAGTGIWLSEKLSKDARRWILIRWIIAYATTYTALFVLALAVAGAFSCFCQWIIMRAVQKEVPALAAKVGDFAGDVVTSLEQASTKWADDSNNVILGFQNDINDDVLDYVRNATQAANNTINTFNHYMQEGLDTVFGGVPQLEKFMKSVIKCLVGNKLDTVQEGLTWVNEKAHVTLPLFPVDVFSVGANDSISGDSKLTTFLSTPSVSATDEITGAVNDVVEVLRSSIIQEALISLALFLVYIAYAFFAVAQAAIRMAVRDRHDDGGRQDPYARHASQQPAPRFPSFGGGAVLETPIEPPLSHRHMDPFGDQNSIGDDKAGYELRGSRDRMGSPTPRERRLRQSEYVWMQDPSK